VNANKPTLKTVLTVRAKVLEYAREWLNKESFIEIQGPILFPAFKENSTHFMVNYFGKPAYLSAGLTPYSDGVLQFFNRIYTIAPAFRAEPIKSKRHLAEYWRIHAFSACNFEAMLTIQEQLLIHILQSLTKNSPKELAELHSPLTNLSQIKIPFPRITYDQAIERLQTNGLKVIWGEPITRDREVTLTKMFDQPFFVTHFPLSTETLLCKSLPTESTLTYSADLLAPQGYGEIGACNELITKKALIEQRLTEAEIAPEDKKWYLQTKKSYIKTQSTAIIGLERLLQWICSLEDIKKTTLIPRQFGAELF
jgi:asparaginyl-tRNA synthetase